MGIEAGRDEDEIRPEPLCGRRENLLKRLLVLGVAAPRRQRHVHRETEPLALALLLGRARAGIERILVDAEIQDRRVGVGHGLGAVSVVDVPIDDEHLLEAVLVLDVPRSQGNVSEETEAHRLILEGVMAGRTDGAEGAADLSRHHRIDGRQHPAHRLKRHVVGLRRDRNVQRVDMRCSLTARDRHAGDVLERVLGRDPLRRRPARFDPDELLEEPRLAEPIDDGRQPLRPFRMARARLVPKIDVAVDKPRLGGCRC